MLYKVITFITKCAIFKIVSRGFLNEHNYSKRRFYMIKIDNNLFFSVKSCLKLVFIWFEHFLKKFSETSSNDTKNVLFFLKKYFWKSLKVVSSKWSRLFRFQVFSGMLLFWAFRRCLIFYFYQQIYFLGKLSWMQWY